MGECFFWYHLTPDKISEWHRNGCVCKVSLFICVLLRAASSVDADNAERVLPVESLEIKSKVTRLYTNVSLN